MKTYIAATGALFGVVAIAHVFVTLQAWHQAPSDPWFVAGEGAVAVVAGALSFWAWRLLFASRRS